MVSCIEEIVLDENQIELVNLLEEKGPLMRGTSEDDVGTICYFTKMKRSTVFDQIKKLLALKVIDYFKYRDPSTRKRGRLPVYFFVRKKYER